MVTSDGGLCRFVRAVDAIRIVLCRSVPDQYGPALPILFPSGRPSNAEQFGSTPATGGPPCLIDGSGGRIVLCGGRPR
jgi:hypothetical protein